MQVPTKNTTCVAPDAYIWVESDKSYYVSIANEHKRAAILAMRELGDFENLASFMKTNVDVVKSESVNVGPSFGRFRRF